MSRETRKEVIAIIQGRDAGGLTPGGYTGGCADMGLKSEYV